MQILECFKEQYMLLLMIDARLLMYSKLSDKKVDDLRSYIPGPVLYKARNLYRNSRSTHYVCL